jgi:3-oxoacyl-[acyl-carrier-protein] synthase II
MLANKPNEARIVITGVGLTAPNANNLAEFRKSLLTGKSGIQKLNIPYIGEVPLVYVVSSP